MIGVIRTAPCIVLPLLVHRLCMQHQVIGCASLAAIDNRHHNRGPLSRTGGSNNRVTESERSAPASELVDNGNDSPTRIALQLWRLSLLPSHRLLSRHQGVANQPADYLILARIPAVVSSCGRRSRVWQSSSTRRCHSSSSRRHPSAGGLSRLSQPPRGGACARQEGGHYAVGLLVFNRCWDLTTSHEWRLQWEEARTQMYCPSSSALSSCLKHDWSTVTEASEQAIHTDL
jgi:hypothetical protein